MCVNQSCFPCLRDIRGGTTRVESCTDQSVGCTKCCVWPWLAHLEVYRMEAHTMEACGGGDINFSTQQ